MNTLEREQVFRVEIQRRSLIEQQFDCTAIEISVGIGVEIGIGIALVQP